MHGLEASRAELIPSIVILLQKLWRGTLARMRYKRMKAALTIYNAWKLVLIRNHELCVQIDIAKVHK